MPEPEPAIYARRRLGAALALLGAILLIASAAPLIPWQLGVVLGILTCGTGLAYLMDAA